MTTSKECTAECLASCGVLSRLGKAGLDLAAARQVVKLVADDLHVPPECRTGGPVNEVCGMYYSSDLVPGVVGAAAVLAHAPQEPRTV